MEYKGFVMGLKKPQNAQYCARTSIFHNIHPAFVFFGVQDKRHSLIRRRNNKEIVYIIMCYEIIHQVETFIGA
jgi:hypothetical protein